MAIVQEEVKHEHLPVELMVSERQKHECRDPRRFIHLNVDTMPNYTPKDLCELGHWLIQQGERLGREYKPNGAPKLAQ